jgi:hypothetical protein
VVTARVLDALPLDHIVIWRPALPAVSVLQEQRTRSFISALPVPETSTVPASPWRIRICQLRE